MTEGNGLTKLAQKLRDAKAAQEPITIDAALLSGCDLSPVENFDKMLRAGFRLPDDGSLKLDVSKAEIGAGTTSPLLVTSAAFDASLKFLGLLSSVIDLSLCFATRDGNGDPVADVQIEATIKKPDWKLSDYFTYMTGWPFSEIDLKSLRFVFSTVEGTYPTNDENGTPVRVGQNLAATLPFPSVFETLFAHYKLPTAALTIVGSIVLDRALAKDTMASTDPTPDPSVELYPDMELRAYVQSKDPDKPLQFDVLDYFKVHKPYIGLRVRTAIADSSEDTPKLVPMEGLLAETGKEHYQSPEILFGAELGLEQSILDLETVLSPKSGASSADADRCEVSFALQPDPKGKPLTPDVVVQKLVTRGLGHPGDSLFGFVPAPLQRFIQQVEFHGLRLSGAFGIVSDAQGPSVSVSSVSIALGSSQEPGSPLVVLPGFAIDGFDLNWAVLDPFGKAHHLINFSTVLTLWEGVFKPGAKGGDGKFHLSIDQDLNLDGAFRGDVDLTELWKTITLGTIEPLACFPTSLDGVNASLSVRPPEHTYAFEFGFGSLTLIKNLLELQNVVFKLSAVTPHKSDKDLVALGWLQDGESGTVFKGELSGLLLIGKETDPGSVAVEASVAYDGSADVKAWKLHAALARPVSLIDLVSDLFHDAGWTLPEFLSDVKIEVEKLSFDATIPSKNSESNGAKPSLKVAGAFDWKHTFTVANADGLAFEARTEFELCREKGQYSGKVVGEAKLGPLFRDMTLDVVVGYEFPPSKPGEATVAEDKPKLWIQWEGVTATYTTGDSKLVFTLEGWTVGKIIQKLVTLVGDPYFSLPAPWDVLNKISLDGLSVTLDLSKDAKHRISASYKLSSPLELGFAKITALDFLLVEGKPTLAIEADVRVPGLKDSDLFNPEKGQDVREIKGDDVPGRGSKLFDLRLLALGQHIAIKGSETFNSTTEAIAALEGKNVPDSKGSTNPVPAVPEEKLPAGTPYYLQKSNWLVATDFGILYVGQDAKKKNIYTIDLQILFNDPNLYGLHLALNGDRVKCLSGLAFDILYKKISDGLGVYQIELTLPDAFRTLSVGAYTITLPIIGFQIYTDGSFLIDFGFPYHLDFSRSLTIQGIVQVGPVPVPVLGSIGFYFGVFSNAAGPHLPKTTKGTFHPVVAFGIGVQFGVGKYINKGVLKAGFSITVFGIVEGVLAPYHPYDPSGKTAEYFWVRGTFGIIGKLFGCVDFGIIKAELSVTVQIYAQIEAEVYKAVHLSVTASVEVKVSVKIHVAFVKITLHFHFHTQVQAKLTIKASGTAPWGAEALSGDREALAAVYTRGPDWQPLPLEFGVPVRADGAKLPKITLILTPAYTILPSGGDAETDDAYEGALVLLLTMDTPAPSGNGALSLPADGEDGASFVNLCRELLPWVLASAPFPAGAGTSYSKAYLEEILDSLASHDRPIPSDEILSFLETSFEIDLIPPPTGSDAKSPDASAVFPVFDGLSAEFLYEADTQDDEGSSDEPAIRVAFGEYTKVTPQYRQAIRKLFEQVAAAVQDEAAGADSDLMIDVTPESIADVVFEDYFVLIARQLLQAAIDGFDGFLYDLGNGNAVADVLKWGNEDRGNAITVSDIVTPNQDHPLVEAKPVDLTGLTYTVQPNDTLDAIAQTFTDPTTGSKRWQLSALEIIEANLSSRALIRPGVTLSLNGNSHTTALGDTFASIAEALKVSTPQQWADFADATKDLGDLLAPTARVRIGALVTEEHGPEAVVLQYTTKAQDTLESILSQFGATLANIFGPDYGTQTGILLGPIPSHINTYLEFATTDERKTIRIANLTSLLVDDLWPGVERSGRIESIAGMASRFLLHGLRLPDQEGLTLPKEFPYPKGPNYGLYQLTGQQLPYRFFDWCKDSFVFAKDDSLQWLEFSGDKATTQLEVDVTASMGHCKSIRDYANASGFDPGAALSVNPAVELVAKRLPVRHSTAWSTSDLSGVGRVALAEEASGPPPQPILWAVPHSILRRCEQVWSHLQKGFPKAAPSDLEAYLPLYTPQVGKTDPASHKTTFTDVSAYALATKIEFQIRRLAQTDDMAPQTPDDNDVIPPDDGSKRSSRRKLAPYTYEVIGPNASDAILLQRILRTIGSSGSSEHVSGIHILYPNQPASPDGLISQAAGEFVSFLARTNLSTETHPTLAVEREQPTEEGTGILNKPDEFLRMLWEESTVRSGGYYLYYKDLIHGRGLPDELFGTDENATLTLVVLYERSPEGSTAARFTDHVNAFATVEQIDVDHSTVALESESSQHTSPALSGEETLQEIADLFGIGIGDVAALNAGQAIVSGTSFTVSGVLHHVSRADAKGAKDFDALAETLAGTYSVTKGEILGWNPGLVGRTGDELLFSAVRIPPIEHKVGPNETIASLCGKYRLEMGELADMMRSAVPFGASTIEVDSQVYDVKPTLGTGNAAMRITRPRPKDIDPDQQGFEKAALDSLYTLMESRLCGVPQNGQKLPAPYNDLFRESSFGMPIGPRDPSEQEKGSRALAHLRRAEWRGGLDEDTVVYAQTLGFRGFSRVNPAPDDDETESVDPAANPYIGVGSFAQMNAFWTDLFGNRSLEAVCDNPTAPSEGGPNAAGWSSPPIPVRYTDRLIGIDQWPSVQARYSYKTEASVPQLEVCLSLDTSPYKPGEGEGWDAVFQRVAQDRKVFERVYFQLHQDYDRTAMLLPGLSGNAVSMSLRHSLLKKGSQTIALGAQEEKVRQFVEDCVAFLSLLREVKDSGAVSGAPDGGPSTTLTFPTPFDALTTESIIPMEVSLMLERQSVLCAPALRGIVEGTSATCQIQPDLSAKDTDSKDAGDGQDIVNFAKVVEDVFVVPDAWQFRVGTGPKDPAQPDTRESYSVWAVRMGETKDAGVYYDFDDALGFYAPKPVWSTLWSGKVDLGDKKPEDGDDEGKTVTFTGVDLNEWFAQVLRAVDAFLTPRFTGPVFLYDNTKGTDYLKDILEQKKSLAASIASSVAPILDTSPTDEATKKAASEKLEQALLNRLSVADDLTAVVVASVRDAYVNGPLSLDASVNPRLYGQPLDASPPPTDAEKTQNFALSTGKIPLAHKNGASADPGDSHLAFLFSSKNPKEQASVGMKPSYALTHLEHGIVQVPGIEGYEQSSWIHFVTGPFEKAVAKAADFPVVLRALPIPPTMKSQSFISKVKDMHDLTVLAENGGAGDLAKWTYAFAFDHAFAAQDSVEVTVWLNVVPSLGEGKDIGPLATALAKFVTGYPALEKNLEAFLQDPSQDPGSTLQSFYGLVQGVATEYAKWVAPSSMAVASDEPVNAKDTAVYRIELVPADPEHPESAKALINVYLVSQHGKLPPTPVILLDPDHYDAVPIPAPVKAGEDLSLIVTYEYKLKADGADDGPTDPYLSYEDALAIAERIVHIPELDIFATQNAWSAAQILRNVRLVPNVETTDDFKFKTPQVKFANPLVALLAYDKFGAGSMRQEAIAAPIKEFFNELFTGAADEAVEVKMEAAISNEQAPDVSDLPRTQVPISLLASAIVPLGVSGVEPLDFVDDLAKEIKDWLGSRNPLIDETSELNFNLHVFANPTANGAEGMLLLSVRDLHWDLTND